MAVTHRLRKIYRLLRGPVRLVVGTAPHQGGIPADQLAALRRGLARFAVDSVPGAGLHVAEEQPAAVVAAVGRAVAESGR